MASKPRVLIVTPFLPSPPVDGGKKRVHTLLRLLSSRYDFTLLSFIQKDDELWNVPALKKYCRAVVPVPLRADALPEREDFFLPQIAKSSYSRVFAENLKALLRDWAPQIVHFEFLQMAQYRPLVKNCPSIFTEHDISNISFFRSYFREMTGWRRWGRILEWLRLVYYQIEACRNMDGIVTLTRDDTDKLKSFLPRANIQCITTGVDLAQFPYRRKNVFS